MGLLTGAHCYLSGAIEHDYNAQTNWRTMPIEILREKFGVIVFDPNADPKQQWATAIKEAKRTNDLHTVVRIASDFVRKDLAKVDRSDFVIARFGYEKVFYPEDISAGTMTEDCMGNPTIGLKGPRLRQIPTTGTVHEIVTADWAHKPTLIVCEEGWQAMPTWLLGFIPERYLFNSWQDLYKYLIEVDNGKHNDDRRWAVPLRLI